MKPVCKLIFGALVCLGFIILFTGVFIGIFGFKEQYAQCAGTKAFVGMSEELLLANCGKPIRINTDANGFSMFKQFVYSTYAPRDYVNTDGKEVTSIQY